MHTDCHLYSNTTPAGEAAKTRLRAFNPSTTSVRPDLSGRTDLLAGIMIKALGFKRGLNGNSQAESVEHKFIQSGLTVSVECNGGYEGKAKMLGKPQKEVFEESG